MRKLNINVSPLEETLSIKHQVNSKHTVSTNEIRMLILDTPETEI